MDTDWAAEIAAAEQMVRDERLRAAVQALIDQRDGRGTDMHTTTTHTQRAACAGGRDSGTDAASGADPDKYEQLGDRPNGGH